MHHFLAQLRFKGIFGFADVTLVHKDGDFYNCCRCACSSIPVPGILPGAGQHWADNLLLSQHRLHLHLQPGHQGEGNSFRREDDQEEKFKPLNNEEEPSEEGKLFKEEKLDL